MKYLVGVMTVWSTAWASCAHGQFLQLPSFDYFSVRTSVLVPDRGGAYLGGVRRSSYGSSSYGMPGVGRLMSNRALGGGAGAAGASVHATVIDHEALDRAVLAEAARRHEAIARRDRTGTDIARRLSRNAPVATSESSGLMSVAEIRRQNAARKQAQQNEARELFAKGEAAQANGRSGVARIFYQMAQRRADAALQQRIAARLNALPSSAGTSEKSR